jgi:putative nucleotidyltransferase with HDIG domain
MMKSENTATHLPSNANDAVVAPPLGATVRLLEILGNSTSLARDISALQKSGELVQAIPEIQETWGARGLQDLRWHPEGSTWTHTVMVLEQLPQDASLPLRLAALFHDIGKPATFFQFPGTTNVLNKGHAHVGADMFRRVIAPRMEIEQTLSDKVATIIDHHMFMHDFFKDDLMTSTFRKSIIALPCFPELVELQHADAMGTGRSLSQRLDSSHRAIFRQMFL